MTYVRGKRTTYVLEHTNGNVGWTCQVQGSLAVGWGSRPELAIRDWKEQDRRWREGERDDDGVEGDEGEEARRG